MGLGGLLSPWLEGVRSSNPISTLSRFCTSLRFQEYGWEQATRILVGLRRIPGALLSIWHPKPKYQVGLGQLVEKFADTAFADTAFADITSMAIYHFYLEWITSIDKFQL